MKTIIVIPTYWGRDSETGWQLGDEIYDHPTPIDQEGTLGRTLESMKIIKNKDFELIILAAVTAPELEEEAEQQLKKIIKEHCPAVKTYLIGDKELNKVKEIYRNKSDINTDLLCLKGYSNIRNICLYSSYVMEADTAILIDDDEVFEDPDFIDKAEEFIGGRLYGQTVDGVAGYYLNRKGEYYDDVEIEPWMTFWNRFGSKTRAFDKIIGSEPRLKKTPFAFGGLMVIHRNLFRIVPFDPEMTRGEDIDYLINAKMFGFNFFLDNKLSIKHLPPKKHHPVWQRLRQDIYRFFYEKSKLETQFEKPNMIEVTPEDFDPYPGEFMKKDLEDKVTKTNLILALDYLTNNQVEDAKGAIKNIYISKYDAVPEKNVFEEYLKIQSEWRELLTFAKEEAYDLREIFKSNKLFPEEIEKELDKKTADNKDEIKTFQLEMFADLNYEEKMALIDISEIKRYKPDENIINHGEADNTLYIILSGRAKITEYNENESKSEDEVILAEMTEGDFFGLTSLISKDNNIYRGVVTAIDPVVVLSFPRDKLVDFFHKYHKSGINLLLYFIEKLNKHLNIIAELYAETQIKTQDIESAIQEENNFSE